MPASPHRGPRFEALLAELKLILAKRTRTRKRSPVSSLRRKSISTLSEPQPSKPIQQREVKLEYYSSLLDKKPDTPKCFSDDCLEYASSYAKRRLAVTEPSTPTAARGPPLLESELSETESQSSVPSDAPFPLRGPLPRRASLSNSLESLQPRRRLKRTRVYRRTSASSTSSYDSRPEPVSRRMRKSASCHVKKEGSESCRCMVDYEPDMPSSTKSLPRNHKHRHTAISRHLNDAMKCEKDCLKILKSVSKDEARSPGPAYSSHRGDSEESYFEPRSSSLPKRSNRRYPKTAEIKKLHPLTTAGPTLALLPPTRFQTIERIEMKRQEKKREKVEDTLQDECVLRIENGDLWIEICKAVQETEARARKVRPRD